MSLVTLLLIILLVLLIVGVGGHGRWGYYGYSPLLIVVVVLLVLYLTGNLALGQTLEAVAEEPPEPSLSPGAEAVSLLGALTALILGLTNLAKWALTRRGRPSWWGAWAPRLVALSQGLVWAVAFIPSGEWQLVASAAISGLTAVFAYDYLAHTDTASAGSGGAAIGAVLVACLLVPSAGCGGIRVERGLEFSGAEFIYELRPERHAMHASGRGEMELNLGPLEVFGVVRAVSETPEEGEARFAVLSQVGVRLAKTYVLLIEFDLDSTAHTLLCVRYGPDPIGVVELPRMCYPLRAPPGLGDPEVGGEWIAP
jgi:hypothetical protein